MTKKVVGAGTIAYAIPFIALAQEGPQLDNLQELIRSVGSVIDLLIPIAFAAGLLFFFWGLAMYIASAGNEEKKAEGRNIMVWGVVALFVMASVWGLVNFIGSALGLDNSQMEVPGILDADPNVDVTRDRIGG